MHDTNQSLQAHRWKGVLFLIRWPNLLIMLGTQILAYVAFMHSVVDAPKEIRYLIYVLILTLCAAASGYIMNDLMDRNADSVNQRNNPLNSGAVSTLFAIRLCCILCAAGLLSALLLISWSVHFLWLYPAVLLLLWAYTKCFKRMVLLGNLAVSCFCAGVIFLIWWPALPLMEMPAGLQSFILFAFLATMIREIVKDMEDVNGDARVGDRTLPIVFGMKAASVTAMLFFLLTLAFLTYHWVSFESNRLKATLWILAAVLLVFTMLYFLFTTKTAKQLHNTSMLIKLTMVMGILFIVS
jgi:4-hydroxybenzoate polyprenyltransferase